MPLLEVTLPGGDRLTLPFASNEYVESQAHGRLTEGGDVGDEPSRGRTGLFDTGEGDPEEVCRLNGGKVREIVPGLRLPDLRALAATWPGPDE
ncbi:hypothetical protein [Streptomyces sp. NPDC094031]|uniref:hypothetical protein n=1 Tax=Streptomyces sp. NPDC094031 TaxID=3155307 RepID=UPI003318C12C